MALGESSSRKRHRHEADIVTREPAANKQNHDAPTNHDNLITQRLRFA